MLCSVDQHQMNTTTTHAAFMAHAPAVDAMLDRIYVAMGYDDDAFTAWHERFTALSPAAKAQLLGFWQQPGCSAQTVISMVA